LNNAQYTPIDYHSAHALFSITLGSHKKRQELVDKLKQNNIPNVIYYKYPIHLMKGYSYLEYKNGDFPVSENLSQTIVSLPMHPYLSKQEIDSIIKELKK
jgi:dTDP-4-amino-4,6-dideoxygalactose transaminase